MLGQGVDLAHGKGFLSFSAIEDDGTVRTYFLKDGGARAPGL